MCADLGLPSARKEVFKIMALDPKREAKILGKLKDLDEKKLMLLEAVLEEDLFPWDEEETQRPPTIRSIPASTSLKTKVRSKPPIQGQEYLELYLMLKEKERLAKYGETMRRTQSEASKGWRHAVKEIQKKAASVEKAIGEILPGEEAESKEVNKEVKKGPRGKKMVTFDY